MMVEATTSLSVDQVDELNDNLARLSRTFAHLTCGARLISPGDELTLTHNEQIQMQKAVARVRRASATARIVARKLLIAAGAQAPIDLCNDNAGALLWPTGFIGSISHDQELAVAAVSESQHYHSIGIDIEPDTPLPDELLKIVATGVEIDQMLDLAQSPKLLFCVKEAVYKATNVLDQVYLDHHDVEFCFRTGIATVQKRRRVKVQTLTQPRLVALAVISKTSSTRTHSNDA